MNSLIRMSTLAWCVVGLSTGCAHWTHVPGQSSHLPTPRMSPDTVVLEIAVVRVPADLSDSSISLWDEVDEQHFSFDLRRRLRENGFRCALAGTQLPERLRRMLEVDGDQGDAGPEAVAQRTHAGTWRERWQSKSGKRYKVVTGPVRDRIDVIFRQEGVVRGQTCHQAHCEFALRTYPQGDGSVRLQLTPEIHYGIPKQRYVGDHHGFIVETQQDRLVLDDLRIESALAPGQTLIVSCMPEMTGLGRHFFVEPRVAKELPKLLLVRLHQTQYDDLFDPGQAFEPIATQTD